MNVRYVACGLLLRQFHRVQLLICWVVPAKVPFEITWVPLGTATDTSKVALSVGWLLLGYHQGAMSGSSTARAPFGVFFHAVNPFASLTVDGLPSYCTTTVMFEPLAIVCWGVTTTSPTAAFRVLATKLLTRIELT